jgi:hypothetical protein
MFSAILIIFKNIIFCSNNHNYRPTLPCKIKNLCSRLFFALLHYDFMIFQNVSLTQPAPGFLITVKYVTFYCLCEIEQEIF